MECCCPSSLSFNCIVSSLALTPENNNHTLDSNELFLLLAPIAHFRMKRNRKKHDRGGDENGGNGDATTNNRRKRFGGIFRQMTKGQYSLLMIFLADFIVALIFVCIPDTRIEDNAGNLL